MHDDINKKVIYATKWTAFTEIVVKIISPITNMILARLLTPEIFGIVASITLVTSFANIFTDVGFQKYIIQHEFKNKSDFDLGVSVAFWTNLIISIIIWGIIIIFNKKIAIFVGCEGYGNVINLTSVILIYTAFSSIQMAVYKKKFRFKKLAVVRIVCKTMPLIITLPLAILGYGYWSLIIGNLIGELINAVILTIGSEWKPKFKYSINRLKEMFSFCGWTLCEAVSAWVVANIGIFLIGRFYNPYYLGLYKAGMTTVNQILSIITSTISSVIFTTLSSLQDNEKEYKYMFLSFQKMVGLFVLPLGIGILIFRETVTIILLGNQWLEVSLLVGCWGLVSSINIVFGNMASFVLLSKGKPHFTFYTNIIQIMLLILVYRFSLGYGFSSLVVLSSLVALQISVTQVQNAKKFIMLKKWEILDNVMHYLVASIIMGVVGSLLKLLGTGLTKNIFYIIICIFVYFFVLMFYPSERKLMRDLLKKVNIK